MASLRQFTIHHGLSKGYMSTSGDEELPQDVLPPGPLPLWVERTESVGDREVLQYLSDQTVGHTTVLYLDYYSDNYSSELSDMCAERGWGYRGIVNYYGCEDSTVICLDSGYVLLPEALTRARNNLCLVTTRGR